MFVEGHSFIKNHSQIFGFCFPCYDFISNCYCWSSLVLLLVKNIASVLEVLSLIFHFRKYRLSLIIADFKLFIMIDENLEELNIAVSSAKRANSTLFSCLGMSDV